MARATGKRLAAALCFLIGGVTIIGIPFFWPAGYLFIKQAREQEAERERELAALEAARPRGGGRPAGWCPECGDQIAADDTFCSECGATLS